MIKSILKTSDIISTKIDSPAIKDFFNFIEIF